MQQKLGSLLVDFVVQGQDKLEQAGRVGKAAMTGIAEAALRATSSFQNMGKSGQDLAVSLTKSNDSTRRQITAMRELGNSGLLQPLLREAVQLEAQLKKMQAAFAFQKLRAEKGTLGAYFTVAQEKASGFLSFLESKGGVLGGIGKMLQGGLAAGAAGSVAGALPGIGTAAMGAFAVVKGLVGAVGSFVGTIGGMVKSGIDGLSRLGMVASFAMGMLLRGALNNTVEGERLSQAWERLAKSLGGLLAPGVRTLTNLLNALSSLINKLDPDTRALATRWMAAGAALAALGTVLPMVITGLSAVAALAVPVGALVAVLGTLGVAFLGLGDKSKSTEEKLVTVVKAVLDAWTYASTAVKAAWAGVSTILFDLVIPAIERTGAAMQGLWGWAKRVGSAVWTTFVTAAESVGIVLEPAIDFAIEAFGRLYETIRKVLNQVQTAAKALGVPIPHAELLPFTQIVADAKKFKSVIEEAIANAKKAWNKGMAELGGNEDRARKIVGGLMGGGKPLTVKHELKFESLDQTWERLQQALNADPGREREEAMLMELKEANNNGKQILAGILGLKDKLQVGFQP